MNLHSNNENQRNAPTRREALVFRCKTILLQMRRRVYDSVFSRVRRFSSVAENDAPQIAVSKTPLWTESEPRERFLLAGKIQNLRLAAERLDGLSVSAGETFSFWKQIGRTSRFKGYVVGRELREGCVIPNIGGGLCQLSNALYDAALQANFDIVERHAHTQVIAGSLAESGRDATVFWNYVDLRFRSNKAFRIEAKLDSENLIVTFSGEKGKTSKFHQINRTPVSSDGPNSCATCEMGDCHRVITQPKAVNFGKTAYLLDEFSPEHDEYVQANRVDSDVLMIPIDGKRFRKANYGWNTVGFSNVRQSVYVTALRSYNSRKLAEQGKARQLNLLAMYEKLAASYAKRLRYDVLHVVVHQNLLPFLWRAGHLGGRTFDVLMTALPMVEIQTRLDYAASLHPESKTLGDFRADGRLPMVEIEALRHARKIITSNTDIARRFAEKAELIDWKLPKPTHFIKPQNQRPQIIFPAATIGRKGCYELRAALQGLDVVLVTLGSEIEEAGFWDGIKTENGGQNWLETADVVVLPAFIEHRPRRLLQAIANDIPVIASAACGVDGLQSVYTVEAGDAVALRNAILNRLETTREKNSA